MPVRLLTLRVSPEELSLIYRLSRLGPRDDRRDIAELAAIIGRETTDILLCQTGGGDRLAVRLKVDDRGGASHA